MIPGLFHCIHYITTPASARGIVTPYITITRVSVEAVCTRPRPSEYSPRPRHTPAKSQMCRDTPGPADVPTVTPIRPCQGLNEDLADEFLRCRPIGVGGVHGALLPGLTQVDTAMVCVKVGLTGGTGLSEMVERRQYWRAVL